MTSILIFGTYWNYTTKTILTYLCSKLLKDLYYNINLDSGHFDKRIIPLCLSIILCRLNDEQFNIFIRSHSFKSLKGISFHAIW